MSVARLILTPFVAACLGGAVGAQLTTGHAPMSARSGQLVDARPLERDTVAAAFIARRATGTDGSLQALEGYALTLNDTAPIALSLGVIGNVEHRGQALLTEARSVTGGGIAYGPIKTWKVVSMNPAVGDRGRVDVMEMFTAEFPKAGVRTKRGVWIRDAEAEHLLAGTVRFSSGHYLQPVGSRLELHGPTGALLEAW